ncbi:MAG: hypothetical protein J0H44_04210 [Alphaproteobacteria bacterium]|nr:hypothetical protein [Alphaproteobacteria bacterium]
MSVVAQAQSMSAHKGSHSKPIAVLIVMPLIMALFGREWLYTPIGYLDPWYNVGFFMFYQDPAFLPDHYKLQRLPWLLPGWGLYHTMGPLAANFILHVGALLIATTFVYLTLARLVGQRSAFVVAATLTIYIPFLGSGGWDYQTAGEAAYYAVTLYLTVRATQAENPRRYLVLTGAAYGAAIYSTIHLVNFLPVVAAFYIVVRRRNRMLVNICSALGCGLVGFSVLTVALCIVNAMVGRGFLFFWPLLKIVIERVEDPAGQKAWWLPLSALLDPATSFHYLAFPVAVLVVSMLRLSTAAVGVGRLGSIRTLLIGQYIFLALLWALWQQLGHPALEPDYFAHVLIIPAFLALGGLLRGEVGEKSSISHTLLACGLLLAFVPGAQGALAWAVAPQVMELTKSNGIEALEIYAVVIVLLVATMPRIAALGSVLVGMAGFSFAFLQLQPPDNPLYPHFWKSGVCVSNEQSFREIIRLIKILKSENPISWQTWIWRGPKGVRTFESGCTLDLDLLRGTMASPGTSQFGLGTYANPGEIPDQYVGWVGDGHLVVAMVQYDKDADGMIERFAKAGKKLTLIRRETINLGKIPILVLIYKSMRER